MMRVLLIAAAVAGGCNGPSFAKVTALDPDSHDPMFPIAAGVHSSLACDECHGAFDSFREFSCIDCHDGTHAQDATDPVHVGLTDYVFDRTSCYGCHPRGEILSDIFHDRFFPISASSPHTGLTCEQCHLTSGDRKQYTCTDCHSHEEQPTAALHLDVAEYRWASDECYRCHPDGSGIPRESHEDFFPIAATSAHEQVACAECHVTPGDRAVVDCIDCHAHPNDQSQTQHARVGGYEYQSDLCLRCHYDSSVDSVSDHRPFRIEGGPHRPQNAPCLRCHIESLPERSWAADFVSFDCRPCHDCAQMDREHEDRRDYQCVSTTCVQSGCHPTGEKD